MRRLPPLTAIEAFVLVARLGSVRAAAEELSLSSPALSRRVQALENFLGRPLFERRRHAMALNAEGEALLARIADPLDQLADAIESATGAGELMRLRLGVLPLFAAQRLMRRLPELRAAHADLHIDIDTAAHGTARLGDGLDAAITLARAVDPSLYARRMERDHIVAIGARALLEGEHPLTDPGGLAAMTIFLHRDMPENFAIWRDAIGEPDLEPAAEDHFDSGQLMLDAAAQGLGVAFMLESHLRDACDDRLASLFGGRSAPSPYSYWFACRHSALRRKPVRLFHDWLFDTLVEESPHPAHPEPVEG